LTTSFAIPEPDLSDILILFEIHLRNDEYSARTVWMQESVRGDAEIAELIWTH